MIFLFFMIFLVPVTSLADIFVKSSDQVQLDQVLVNDMRNVYFQGGYDYNAYAHPQNSYELTKDNISLGCNRYDFHESLKSLIKHPEFNNLELEALMQQLSTSRFLVWQYSSPTLADLYKYLSTTGQLRLNMRYQQCEDLENNVGDPLVKLRKQAIMDCLKNTTTGSMEDIDAAFKICFDHLHAGTNLSTPYASLEDPGNGNFNIVGTINVTDKVLDRVNRNSEDLTDIKLIIPRITMSRNEVNVYGPRRKSRELIAQYRSEFLSRLIQIIQQFKRNRTFNNEELSSLSVFGVPLTEGQLKNVALLGDTTAYLYMNKIASNLAYLKTVDQYLQASQMLSRVMGHPAIEPGYKNLLKNSLEFIDREIITLKEEKERLGHYADAMHSILDEADNQRLKALAQIKDESNNEKEKGLLKLNP